MVRVPIITPLAKIITLCKPIILLLSKMFLMSHKYIFKINITHVYIMSHKLNHINVNTPNNPLNINTTRNLLNTNGFTDGIFLSVI